MSGEPLNSFALIDAAGRLAYWDEGFVQEFRFAAHLLKPGAPYAEIARAAAENPDVRALLANSGFGDLDSLFETGIDELGNDLRGEYRTPEGRIIRVEQYRSESGSVRRFARDVTEERDAGDRLTTVYRRLDAAAAGLGGVLTETRRTPDGNYFFQPIDEPLQRLLDLPAECVGQDAIMFFARMMATAEDHARNSAHLEHSAQTLECIEQDYCVRDGNDRTRWLRHSMMPRRETDGTVVFSGALRDVTREKEAEDQVELLRSVVVRSSDSIVIFETVTTPKVSTKILYVNTKFTELFGGTAEALTGRPMEVLAANDFERVGYKILSAARERDDGVPVEYQAKARDGRVFWLEVRVKTVQKLDDGAVRWVVISRDVSKRRQAQDELLRAKEQAEAGNRAKGDFLANMSHELRTPLNAIIGFTELIEQGVARTGWTPDYAEYLTDVSQSGRHLLDLINTILDLSKIEAGQLDLDPAPVDLSELVRASLALVSGMVRDGGIALSVDLPSDYSEIPGDYLKLKQVILNVVSNAIKFTPRGGKVSVTACLTETAALIEVADTGCGIPPADQQRVLMPFVQGASSLSRQFGGSGLGLSIAHKLCSLHGGTLTLDSIEGKGTTVRISLPRIGALAA
jgi:PAS domain S-box-containing protein